MATIQFPTDAEVINAMLKSDSLTKRSLAKSCQIEGRAFTQRQKENWPLVWAEYEAKAVEMRDGK